MSDKEAALEVWRMGAIDRVALLQALNYHSWSTIVKRMRRDEGPSSPAAK